MDIYREKEYLYSVIREMIEERRRITDTIYGFKERLDYILSLEQKGLTDLSLQGYVDLYNKTNRELSTANIERETKHMIRSVANEVQNVVKDTVKDTARQSAFTQRVADYREQQTDEREEAKRHYNTMVENQAKRAIAKINKEPEPEMTKGEKIIQGQRQQDMFSRKAPRTEPYLTVEKVVESIAHVLKEEGVPMQVKDMYEKVQEHYGAPIKYENFKNNIIHRAVKRNDRIMRASRGFYQYKFS
ncbi:hypothetical protein AB3N02_22640 [Priestia aryabhattai]|uniref:hypothetical protein n=1 Tax=Priestia aryabhattai TaxID=412384 RepID=UPI0039A207C4